MVSSPLPAPSPSPSPSSCCHVDSRYKISSLKTQIDWELKERERETNTQHLYYNIFICKYFIPLYYFSPALPLATLSSAYTFLEMILKTASLIAGNFRCKYTRMCRRYSYVCVAARVLTAASTGPHIHMNYRYTQRSAASTVTTKRRVAIFVYARLLLLKKKRRKKNLNSDVIPQKIPQHGINLSFSPSRAYSLSQPVDGNNA